MKNKDLYTILENVYNNYTDIIINTQPVTSFKMVKNINLIISEIDLIDTYDQASTEYVEYDKRRGELCAKFAARDENGEFIKKIDPNSDYDKPEFIYDIDENDPIWIEAINNLKNEYKTAIDIFNKKQLQKMEILELPVSITFEKLHISNITNMSEEIQDILKPFLY